MFDRSSPTSQPLSADHRLMELDDFQVDAVFKAVLRRVYLWMALGLLVTAGAALATLTTPLGTWIFSNTFVFYGFMIGELVLVMALSAGIRKLHPSLAGVMFFAYAGLNGITLSIIFAIYELGSIGLAFFVTAALFGAMSIIGYSTKKDLSQWRSYLMMGLIGLLIASVANIFFASSGMDWLLSIFGVFLFLGLTIYDTQRIKHMTMWSMQSGDEAVEIKMGILGALKLYLDFINIFLYMLRLFGRRRR